MFNEIVNPKTGRKVNINSNIGKNILKKYIKYYKTMMIGGKSYFVGDSHYRGRYNYYLKTTVNRKGRLGSIPI